MTYRTLGTGLLARVLVLLLSPALFAGGGLPLAQFLRGDVNQDARTDLADPIYLLEGLFREGPAWGCDDSADANDDGSVDLSDVVRILLRLFAGLTIPAPSQPCGTDPTEDDLGCGSFAPCGDPAPELLSVKECFGNVFGGTRVVLRGRNFSPAARVEFGGAPAGAVSFIDRNTLTAVAPPSRIGLGTVAVRVTQPGVGSGMLEAAFTYTPVSPEPEPRRNQSLGTRQTNPTGGVLLHSGEFRLERTDLAIAARGQRLELKRTYRSGYDHDGPLGYGWDANFLSRLQVLPRNAQGRSDVLYFDGAGRVVKFESASAPESFQSPPGYYSRLFREADGGFVLRRRDGFKETYRPDGELMAWEDRLGNRVEFERDGAGKLIRIRDDLGRAIDLDHDAEDRLQSLTDFTGRQVTFRYQGSDLVAATGPVVIGTPHGNDFPDGKTEEYVYDADSSDPRLRHNLEQVVAPRQVADGSRTPRIINTYGSTGSTHDRLVRQVYGGTVPPGIPAGGALEYHYDFAPADGPPGTARRTRVLDRRGNAEDTFHDERGLPLRVVEDPAGRSAITEVSYNQDGERTRTVFPLGNSVEYSYDEASPDRSQQGNLLTLRRLPDPTRGGGQEAIEWAFTYEPLYHQPRTITLPRGRDPSFEPPNGGGNSPERYTFVYTYDYQEAAQAPAEAVRFGIVVPPELLGKGDLNADGRTDQAMGNPVRTDRPTVHLIPATRAAVSEGDTAQEIFELRAFNFFGQLSRVVDARGNVTLYSYYPEADPDGDGQDLVAGRDQTTGGYLKEVMVDAEDTPTRKDKAAPARITQRFYEADPSGAFLSTGRDRRGNATHFTDGKGSLHRRAYNALDQVVEEEDPPVHPSQETGYLRRFHFDANDSLVRVEAQNVRPDPSGVPVVVTEHPWFVHSLAYDILGNLVVSTLDATRPAAVPASGQPEMLVRRLVYDANESVVRVESPAAASGAQPDNVLEYTRDGRGRVTALTRGAGGADAATVSFAYDQNGNRIARTDAADNDGDGQPETARQFYDGFDRRVGVVDRAGNEQRVAYDPEDRPVKIESRGPIDGSSGVNVPLKALELFHDEAGRVYRRDQALFLPQGVETLQPVTLADGALSPGDGLITTLYGYDALGRLTSLEEDDRGLFEVVYDGAGRVVQTLGPPHDPAAAPQDAIRNLASYTHDGSGNVLKRVDGLVVGGGAPAAAVTSHYLYDALNRLVRITDNRGQTTYADFDAQGNVVSTFDAQASSMADPLGIVPGMINARGNPVHRDYDGIGRLWQTRIELRAQGLGDRPLDTSNPAIPDGIISTVVEWDPNSRVAARADENGRRTTFSYDALDRLVSRTNADGGTKTFAFDADDNIVRAVDENNTVHRYRYDARDRLVEHGASVDPSRRVPGTSLPLLVGTTLQRYEYDGLTRITSAFDNNDPQDSSDDALVRYRYDSLSHRVEETQNGRAVGSSQVSGKRSSLHYPGGGQGGGGGIEAGRTAQLSYNGNDQLARVDDGTVAVSMAFRGNCCDELEDAFGGSGDAPVFFVRFELDENLLPANLLMGGVDGPFAFLGFGRDRMNRVRDTSLNFLAGDDSGFISLFATSDSHGSLADYTQASRTPRGPLETKAASLVSGGAREIRRVQRTPGGTVDNSFNAVYENVARSYNASPGTGIRTRDERFTYQWDAWDRLRVVRDASTGSEVARYRYDADLSIFGGRRIEKTVAQSGALDGTTRYIYDRQNVIEERVVSGGGERLSRQYVHGDKPDQVLAMHSDTDGDGGLDQSFFYVRAHNGSIAALVDQTGKPAEYYHHEPLAPPLVLDGATGLPVPPGPRGPASPRGNPYLFTGQRYDPETGLHYFRARMFDSVSGEFLSRDPMGAWFTGDNLGNGFAFAGNDLLDGRDPSGLDRYVGGILHQKIAVDIWDDGCCKVIGQTTFEIIADGDLSSRAGAGETLGNVILALVDEAAASVEETPGKLNFFGGQSTMVTIPSDCNADKALLAELKRLKKYPPTFNLTTFNCRSFVSKLSGFGTDQRLATDFESLLMIPSGEDEILVPQDPATSSQPLTDLAPPITLTGIIQPLVNLVVDVGTALGTATAEFLTETFGGHFFSEGED